ncbi:GNAT family N-acetyltransferase [Shewanella salipaludis]|uniref:GNAT family N-acetyltransferase n=1 Tax=Shewanella salipaludis TaxID=2723052 RepID=A0A972JHR5_9GAMM|nr:GNAT family N-acetyltransferase [Shewanella salipaludis]NMH64268.1 GNAT family N-acetyltransferase [Shewanella salipaludis]
MTLFDTDRLVFKRLECSDADFILALLNSQGFLDNIGDRGVRTLAQASDYIAQGPMASYAEFGFGLYRVELKTSGEVIGICGLIKRPALPHVDIGYAFLPQYWGKGYAMEAARATLSHAKALGIDKLLAIVSPHNQASKTILLKLGLSFEHYLQLTPEDDEVELYTLGLNT